MPADRTDLGAWREKLSAADPRVRAEALRSAAWTRDDADRLARMLDDPDEDVQDAAAQALGGRVRAPVGEARHAAALVARLTALAAALGAEHTERAFGRLVVTMRALGHIGDASAVAPLVALTEHASAAVRAQAAYTLGRFADPRVLPALEALLQRPDTDRSVGREVRKLMNHVETRGSLR